MNSGSPPQGHAPPVLVLCRQCVRYVFEGTTICPHCGGDSRETGERYRDEGYLAIETMLRIDRLRSAAEDRTSRENDTQRPRRQ
jgi:uncharacterized OB-fold protein